MNMTNMKRIYNYLGLQKKYAYRLDQSTGVARTRLGMRMRMDCINREEFDLLQVGMRVDTQGRKGGSDSTLGLCGCLVLLFLGSLLLSVMILGLG
jgi:hypothetical protein